MMIEITPQSIVTAASVVTAVILLIQRFAKGVRWLDRQEKQTMDLNGLREKHDADVKQLRSELAADMAGINEEQQMLTYGVLACLKGLQEKGCNGPVTDAISKIEKYLNAKAHEN